jgi:hypothetical protein
MKNGEITIRHGRPAFGVLFLVQAVRLAAADILLTTLLVVALPQGKQLPT